MIDDMYRINYKDHCYRITPYVARKRFADYIKMVKDKIKCDESIDQNEFTWARAMFQTIDDSGLFRCGESRILNEFLNKVFEQHIKYG